MSPLQSDQRELLILTRFQQLKYEEVAVIMNTSVTNINDAFILETSQAGQVISVKNQIKNLKDLPQHITIHNGSQKISFCNKAEFKKYQQEQEHNTFERMTTGVDMEIQIEIKVPRHTETLLASVYGMIEVKDFAGHLTARATYGGIDAALIEKTTGALIAETNYGEIFSNLDALSSIATNPSRATSKSNYLPTRG